MLPRSARILIALIAGPLTGALLGVLFLPATILLQDWSSMWNWRAWEEAFAWGLITFAPVGAIFGVFPGAPLVYWIVWKRRE